MSPDLRKGTSTSEDTLPVCTAVRDFPRGDTTHTVTHPNRESMSDHSTDSAKVQLGEPVSITGVACRSMGEINLQEQK